MHHRPATLGAPVAAARRREADDMVWTCVGFEARLRLVEPSDTSA